MSQWTIVLLRPARRYLERLPVDARCRILDALQQLQDDPARAPVKPLRGRPEWSLRVGGVRVLLMLDRNAQRIVVTRIGPRGDVYR